MTRAGRAQVPRPAALAAALGLALPAAAGAEPLSASFAATCLAAPGDLEANRAAFAERAGGTPDTGPFYYGPFLGTARAVTRGGAASDLCMVTRMVGSETHFREALGAAEARISEAAGAPVARDCRGEPGKADCRWLYESDGACREIVALVREERVVSLALYGYDTPCAEVSG